jgi:hypothetical protein
VTCQIESAIGTHILRNDPNSIEWQYNLITKQEDTYGGRVIQLLGVNIQGLTVQAEAGSGGPEYRRRLALFFRDLLIHQRDTASPATFSYPKRKFKFHVYVSSFQYVRALTEQPSRPFQIQFQVVEELGNTITKSIMSKELQRLNEGIGWAVSQYNDVTYKPPSNAPKTTHTPVTVPQVPIAPGGPVRIQ